MERSHRERSAIAKDMPLELRQAIKALSDDIRLELLSTLLRNNEMTFNQLMNELQLGKNSLSHNLAVLVSCGLAESLYGKTTCDSIYSATTFGEELFKNMLSSFELAASPIKSTQSPSTITAFMSASFSVDADEVVDWFRKVAKSLGINTIWLKEKYESRPAKEKILDNIDKCDALIQIITSDVYKESKEAGWIGNEIAWAYRSKPSDCLAIFVEKNAAASGLARTIADNLEFDRNDLQDVAPKVIMYLVDLKYKVETKRRKVG